MKWMIKDLTNHLESIAPLHLQETYDNAGLLTGNPNHIIRGTLLALDALEEVIDEAILTDCNLVIAHHPIVFRGLKSITGQNYVERAIIKAIKNDIAIYAIHTNLDNVLINGVNSRIAKQLLLENLKILKPLPNNHETGAGLIGKLPKPMPETEFLEFLKLRMQARCIKHTRLLGRPVNTVAVCGGAGSFLIPQAINSMADVFVTSDLKYHEYFDADGHLVLADIGHYESEQFTIDLLYDIIQQKMSTFALRKTELLTNPVRYFQ